MYRVLGKDETCSCVCELVAGSICAIGYFSLLLVFEHPRGIACCTAIVVTPLDTLMKDEEHSLRERGVKSHQK